MDHPATYELELAPGFIGLADARKPKWLYALADWPLRQADEAT